MLEGEVLDIRFDQLFSREISAFGVDKQEVIDILDFILNLAILGPEF